MKKTVSNVDAYLAGVGEPSRSHLQKVRAAVKALEPEAVEGMSYGIPTFKYKGKPLLHFGAARTHLALYGVPPASLDPKEIARYDTSKGTIRFPLDKPIPAQLVRKIVRGRRAEIDAQIAAKEAAPRKARAAR